MAMYRCCYGLIDNRVHPREVLAIDASTYCFAYVFFASIPYEPEHLDFVPVYPPRFIG